MSQMRRSSVKPWGRLGPDGEQDSRGRLFVSPAKSFEVLDLTGVTVCHAGVDTVRALYCGVLQHAWRERFEDMESGAVVRVGRVDFLFRRMGKASGYRYSLQAADVGVQVLLGSFYAPLELRGGHLKVELSPHFLMARGVEVVQAALDALARHLLHDFAPSGVAVHLACDVQGWCPDRIGERLVTRARRCAEYEGRGEVVFNLAEASATYGKGETYTLGLPNSLQMCLYRKDIEAVRRDKLDYWRSRWESYTFGGYQLDAPVWRLEMRFHHSVVRDLGRSQGEEWRTFAEVAPHITDLWRYALGVHRLHRDATRKLICPYWQMLTDDIVFFHPARGDELFRQKEISVDAVQKNIQGLLGNLLTLAARRNDGVSDQVLAQRVVWSLRQLSCWREIARYFSDRQLNEEAMQVWVEDRLRERRLRGRAA